MVSLIIYLGIAYLIVTLLFMLGGLTRWGISRLWQERFPQIFFYRAIFVLLLSPCLPYVAVTAARRNPLIEIIDAQSFFNAYYFLYTYLFASVLLLGLLSARQEKHRRKSITWITGLALLLSPWFPYGLVFAQTALFGRTLRPAVYQAFNHCDGWCGDVNKEIVTYRVLRITPTHAEVYIVQPCEGLEVGTDLKSVSVQNYGATALYLKRDAQGWRYAGHYDSLWSGCGSADGDVFPPNP